MSTHTPLPLRHHPLIWDTAIAILAMIGVGGILVGFWFSNLHVLVSLPHYDSSIISSSPIRQAYGDVLMITSVIGLLLLFYGSFIAPRRITLNINIIQIKELPPITIAIAADFHVGPYKEKKYLHRIVKRINALQADLIVLPGDFLFDATMSDVDDLTPLMHLRAPLGVFAVLGNHDAGQHIVHHRHFRTVDRGDDVTAKLTACGITVLRNQSVMITHNKQTLAIVGIDDLWSPTTDLQRALTTIPTDMPVILLAHNPDIVLDPSASRARLIISGHTHGGQIRLPFIGALAPIPTETRHAYDQGLFTLSNGATLALTHGIGETMCRARFFCPPEILLLHINPTT